MHNINNPYWNVTVVLSTWPDIAEYKRRMDAKFMRVQMFSTHKKFGTNAESAISRLVDCFDSAIEPGNNVETLIIVDMYCEKLGSAAVAMLKAHPGIDFRFVGTENLNITNEDADNAEKLLDIEFVKEWVKRCVDNSENSFKLFYEYDKISEPTTFDYDFDVNRYEVIEFGQVRVDHDTLDDE